MAQRKMWDKKAEDFKLRGKLYTLMTEYAQSEGTDPGGAMRDVLTDLMHIAKMQDFDWQELLQRAEAVYLEEVKEERRAKRKKK